jgi:hypothetical protein
MRKNTIGKNARRTVNAGNSFGKKWNAWGWPIEAETCCKSVRSNEQSGCIVDGTIK